MLRQQVTSPIQCPGGRHARPSRRGFTLLEITVVLIILAILAGMIVPRLYGNEVRMFQNTCEQVSDMLTMYAKRENLSSKPVGLVYDEQRRWLIMVEFDLDETDTADWRRDALIPPVRLPEFAELIEVQADGNYVDISQWPLSNRPGQARPSIVLSLQGPDRVVTFVMPPYAVAPRQIGGFGREVYYPTQLDLNALGRSRGEW